MSTEIYTTECSTRYYTSRQVMAILRLGPKNYVTFRKLCRKLKLPRMKIGRTWLFPCEKFDRRLDTIEKAQCAKYTI